MPRGRATCLVLIASLLGVAGATAPDSQSSPTDSQSPATSPTTVPSADWLKQLASSDWRQRRRAIDQAVQTPGDVEPLLRQLPLRKLDEESRKNVELAIAQTREYRMLGPSPITLHLKDATPAQIFEQIQRQCFAPLETAPENLWQESGWLKLSLDVDRQPFWQVMRDLSERLNIDFLSATTSQVRITRGRERPPDSVCVDGAFLLTLAPLDGPRWMAADLAVYPEPKITLLRVCDLVLEHAVDDRGNVLVPQMGRPGFGRWRRFNHRGSSSENGRMTLSFKHPPHEVVRIARFQGHLTASVQLGSQPWEIGDLLNASPITRVVDSIPITILSFTGNASGSGYELVLLIPNDGSNVGAQEEVLSLARKRLKIVDANGEPLSFITADAHTGGESIELSIAFAPRLQGGSAQTGMPAKLIWDLPLQTRQMTLRFDFRDVPISDPYN